MKLIIKQINFSKVPSFEVYDEENNIICQVKGQETSNPQFLIYDTTGEVLGCLEEKENAMLATFDVYIENNKIGQIRRINMIKPNYFYDFANYKISGSFFSSKYSVKKEETIVAEINKASFKIKDTYTLEINEGNILDFIFITLVIDRDNFKNR